MKFKYSVIGDNTRENREWLEKLGYVNFDYNFKGTHIISYWSERYKNNYYQCVTYHELISLRMYESSINCIGNSSLFKAVSAMREDSDYMQWFVTDFSNKLIPTEPMYLSENKYFNGVIIPHNNNIYIHEDGFHIGSTGFHKATLTELQERFKEK